MTDKEIIKTFSHFDLKHLNKGKNVDMKVCGGGLSDKERNR